MSFSLFILEWIFCIASVITNLRQSKLGIEHLDKLILIKKWPSDICFGCNGPLKPKAMAKFLERDCAIIEEHNKLIKTQSPFEEDSSFDFI
jgi:hypothetical protein